MPLFSRTPKFSELKGIQNPVDLDGRIGQTIGANTMLLCNGISSNDALARKGIASVELNDEGLALYFQDTNYAVHLFEQLKTKGLKQVTTSPANKTVPGVDIPFVAKINISDHAEVLRFILSPEFCNLKETYSEGLYENAGMANTYKIHSDFAQSLRSRQNKPAADSNNNNNNQQSPWDAFCAQHGINQQRWNNDREYKAKELFNHYEDYDFSKDTIMDVAAINYDYAKRVLSNSTLAIQLDKKDVASILAANSREIFQDAGTTINGMLYKISDLLRPSGNTLLGLYQDPETKAILGDNQRLNACYEVAQRSAQERQRQTNALITRAEAIAMNGKDLYDWFKIEKTDNDRAILSAYRKLALQYKTDENTAREINEAKDILLYPKARAAYDAKLAELERLQEQQNNRPRKSL